MQSIFVFVLSFINFFLPCIVSDDQYRDYTWEKPLISQCSSIKKYNRIISDTSVSDGIKTYYSMYYVSRMGITFPINQSNWKDARKWFKRSTEGFTDGKTSIPTENIVNSISLIRSVDEAKKIDLGCFYVRDCINNVRLLSQANYRLDKKNDSSKHLLRSSKTVKPSLYNTIERSINARVMQWMEIRRIGRPDSHLSPFHKERQGKEYL